MQRPKGIVQKQQLSISRGLHDISLVLTLAADMFFKYFIVCIVIFFKLFLF